MAWYWIDEPWQYRVLDALPPGVDEAQHAHALSPTERVQSVVDLIRVAQDLQSAMRASASARDLFSGAATWRGAEAAHPFVIAARSSATY